MPALHGISRRLKPSHSVAQQPLTRCRIARAARKQHAARCSAHSSDAQRPLVVVGSVNADLVLQVNRMPDAGETLTADSLDYFPGGKVRIHVSPIDTRN
jgi:hypothetical protein